MGDIILRWKWLLVLLFSVSITFVRMFRFIPKRRDNTALSLLMYPQGYFSTSFDIFHTTAASSLSAKARKKGNQKRSSWDDEDDLDLDITGDSSIPEIIRISDDLGSEKPVNYGDNIDDEITLADDDDDLQDEEGVDLEEIDDDDESSADESPSPVSDQTWRSKVEYIILSTVNKLGLHIYNLKWLPNRIEVILSNSEDPENPLGPSVEQLRKAHKSIYEEFEVREAELEVVTRFEILVASPGIGEFLRTDQDFISFRGFLVTVTTREEFKKKTKFEGTLIERTDDSVSISMKGRIVKLPRAVVQEVRLPKPKYESTDTEMRKLR